MPHVAHVGWPNNFPMPATMRKVRLALIVVTIWSGGAGAEPISIAGAAQDNAFPIAEDQSTQDMGCSCEGVTPPADMNACVLFKCSEE